ncbi:MAG: hypothetical protein ABI253_00305 [Mycobacterium sp.]
MRTFLAVSAIAACVISGLIAVGGFASLLLPRKSRPDVLGVGGYYFGAALLSVLTGIGASLLLNYQL